MCKKQEELIENMVGPLEQLRQSANAVFAKVRFHSSLFPMIFWH